MTNQQVIQKSQELIGMRSLMQDYALMLIAVFAVSVYRYGVSALWITVLSVVTCFICRKGGEKILHCDFSSRDFSTFVTAVTFAMLLPSTATWWMVVSGAIFAIVVCVLPFGKTANSPFVPAAAAICFVTLCWPDRIFLFDGAEMTVAKMLSQGTAIGRNTVAILEVLTGHLPSFLGAGCTIALIGALIFFAIRHPKNSVSAFSFLLAVVIMAFAFPRIGTGRLLSVFMEICGGSVLFCAIFFITYPSVLPERTLSRGVWGFSAGIICMLMRYFGAFEEPICFGILIACAISGLFEKLPLAKREKTVKALPNSETVVSEEVLNEIPDIEEIPQESEKETTTEENAPATESESFENESLEAVVSEENTVNTEESVFGIGGDGNE